MLMRLRINVQLSILAAGVIGGLLANFVFIYVLPPLPFSDEVLFIISSKNIKLFVFIAGVTFMFFLSLLLGALIPALLVGFKQYSSVFLTSRLYSLGLLLHSTVNFALIGVFSGRNFQQWLYIYLAQIIVIFLTSYGMVWCGALARLTRHSRGTR